MDYQSLIGNNSGLSLIEALVSGVLLAICAGGIFTIFYAFNEEIESGTRQSLLHAQAQTIYTFFQHDLDSGTYVLNSYEDTTIDFATTTLVATNAFKIWSNQKNDTIAKYRINNNNLQKWDEDSSTYRNIKIGKNNIIVTNTSTFRLFPGRRELQCDLQFILNYYGKIDSTAKLIGGGRLFKCRN